MATGAPFEVRTTSLRSSSPRILANWLRSSRTDTNRMWATVVYTYGTTFCFRDLASVKRLEVEGMAQIMIVEADPSFGILIAAHIRKDGHRTDIVEDLPALTKLASRTQGTLERQRNPATRYGGVGSRGRRA